LSKELAKLKQVIYLFTARKRNSRTLMRP